MTVTLRSSDGRGWLIVQDDGTGMPNLIDDKNSPSLGLKLIHVLTKQIGGAVRTELWHGTKVILEFPT